MMIESEEIVVMLGPHLLSVRMSNIKEIVQALGKSCTLTAYITFS